MTRKRVQIKFTQESKTEQSHMAALNVNKIVAKYQKTGLLPNRQGKEPMYGDFTGIEDFHTCQNRIAQAKTDFMSLPSDIRERFHNDPGELVQFINDPDNIEEARELGLLPYQEATPAEGNEKIGSNTGDAETLKSETDKVTQINSEPAK